MKIYDEKQLENNIGLCIYFMRKENELSAYQLGQLIGKTECAITAWERGERMPSINSVIKLCNAFSCTLDEFLISYQKLQKQLQKEKEQERIGLLVDEAIKKRNEHIYKIHMDGATFKQIASIYCMTPEKVADICQKEQEHIDKKEDTLWQFLCVQNKESISLRVYNCLRRKGIHTKDSLLAVIDKLISGNIQFPQFGKGCRDYLERIYKSEHLGGN